jgi:hypothetical protein
MKRTNLIRWSGMACILAGMLYALATVIHPVGEGVHEIASALWTPAHTLGGISAVLMLLGLIGLFAHSGERFGRFLWFGFILAVIGTVLLASEEFQSATVMPLVAAEAPKLIEEFAATGGALAFGLAFVLTFFLGYLFFGIGALRTKLYPRWSAVLLIVGLVLSLGGSISHFISVVAAIIFGLGLAWMGYAVWSEPSSPSMGAA